jgi:hypothetical protein
VTTGALWAWLSPHAWPSGPGATTQAPAGTSTGRSAAVSTTFPPPEPARHTIADLLKLIGAVRRIAYDVTLEAGDALRRIRDLYADYDAGGAS